MTAQAREILKYNNQEYFLNCLPFSQYIDKNNLKHIPTFSNTALWRGYMGKWEITENKLYLTDISGSGILYNFEKNEKERKELERKMEKAKTFEEMKLLQEQIDRLHHQKSSERDFSLKSVFNSDEKVFASWYSGIMTVSSGNMSQYTHSGFSTIYGDELSISINKGIVKDIKF
jgi:hypothetical protein